MPVLSHIETSQLICCANQLTGFYMRARLAFNELTYYLVVTYFTIIKCLSFSPYCSQKQFHFKRYQTEIFIISSKFLENTILLKQTAHLFIFSMVGYSNGRRI